MESSPDRHNASKKSSYRTFINRTTNLTDGNYNTYCDRNNSKFLDKTKHSFRPSVRHDKIYEQSTPYEKSLEKIRLKYQKDREFIYGVDFKPQNSTLKNYNTSINELARNKTESKSKNKKKLEYLEMNNFSKLIAFASMLSENEPKIKLIVIEEY